MPEQEPESKDWFWVDKKDGRHILLVGKPDLPINDVVLECGNISSEHQDKIVANPRLLRVATSLDEFQKLYAENTHDDMPGNLYYGTILMAIVTDARVALAKARGEARS